MEKHKRIDMDPKVMFGKPVIKNTRITVEHVLRKLSLETIILQVTRCAR